MVSLMVEKTGLLLEGQRADLLDPSRVGKTAVVSALMWAGGMAGRSAMQQVGRLEQKTVASKAAKTVPSKVVMKAESRAVPKVALMDDEMVALMAVYWAV